MSGGSFVGRALVALKLRKPPPKTLPRRSDPCPCGSGQKFKDCHLRQVLAEARAKKA